MKYQIASRYVCFNIQLEFVSLLMLDIIMLRDLSGKIFEKLVRVI